MKCSCGGHSEVIGSQTRDHGRIVRRRRQCLRAGCKKRWTTIEHEAQRVVAYIPKGNPNG